MTASERLLNTGEYLEVFQYKNDGQIGVCFKNSEIRDGHFLVGECGFGNTFEEACEEYLRMILGKTIIFNAYTTRRREIKFI